MERQILPSDLLGTFARMPDRGALLQAGFAQAAPLDAGAEVQTGGGRGEDYVLHHND